MKICYRIVFIAYYTVLMFLAQNLGLSLARLEWLH